jgi:hypothetical protein
MHSKNDRTNAEIAAHRQAAEAPRNYSQRAVFANFKGFLGMVEVVMPIRISASIRVATTFFRP